ncbi:alanine--tRNA ligase [Dictyocaulus viviparus]|uniref:Alanine--tRNA ligase n=1 Tax=Dictyocaulus viviparus TaxID=29172 RepID=A0A0D8XPW3_DICVI|nr:alanine--tRNA ligase [Dictyocaulus viviparus]
MKKLNMEFQIRKMKVALSQGVFAELPIVLMVRLRRFFIGRLNGVRHYMSTDDIRRSFIRFFENHGHLHVPSSSVLAPSSDESLIFTNAGMNQFKSLFMGDSNNKGSSFERVVNYQKCIRAGGKHNDLDNVGRDLHHLSFFEMLGNWSFNGAYSKENAYRLAWCFLTEILNIDPDRLYITYFSGSTKFNLAPDDTSRRIWLEMGLQASHILPFNDENFWEMGPSGPCGPCCEIHFDRLNGRKNAGHFVNEDSSIVELWNIVSISHMKKPCGDLQSLPNTHIDTGMGLERLSSIVQNVVSIYDIDVFTPIIKQISHLSKKGNYEGRVGSADIGDRDASYRILADHMRSAVIALSDGVQFSAVDAGFMIRKMLRRSFWHSVTHLGFDRFACADIVPIVIGTLKTAYPELQRCEESIVRSVMEEEFEYWKIIDKGKSIFERIRVHMPTGSAFAIGEHAFVLHDTHGVPVEITQDLCRDYGLIVDMKRYQELKDEAKTLSKSKSKLNSCSIDVSEFVSQSDRAKYQYNLDENNSYGKIFMVWPVFPPLMAKVIGILYNNKRVRSITSNGSIVLDNCQFYAEEGGQKCDRGFLEIDEDVIFEVRSVEKINGISFLHGIVMDRKEISEGAIVRQRIDVDRRLALMRAHSATHLLNWALRRVGAGQAQRGSAVDEDSLRFDYAVDDIAGEDGVVEDVEYLILDVISKSRPVVMEDMKLRNASLIPQLQSEFKKNKKYPDIVRVVQVNDALDDALAVECCAGTHVLNTSSIIDFTILSDRACAKGVRRIYAVTGERARQCRRYGEEILSCLMSEDENVLKNSKTDVFKGQIDWAQLPHQYSVRCRELIKKIKKTRKLMKSDIFNRQCSDFKRISYVDFMLNMKPEDNSCESNSDDSYRYALTGENGLICTNGILDTTDVESHSNGVGSFSYVVWYSCVEELQFFVFEAENGVEIDSDETKENERSLSDLVNSLSADIDSFNEAVDELEILSEEVQYLVRSSVKGNEPAASAWKDLC